MSQFDKIVKNIAVENKKCGDNPEKGKNWVDIGWYSQAQKECWKRMDFKTRIRLSQTCRSERLCFNQYIQNFNDIVENIASESEKSNYNPEIDMNWLDLPMEMRWECVKRMNFKTRCRFRRTSQAEKSLVDSKKIQFGNFKIFRSRDFKWNVIAEKRSESCQFEVHSKNGEGPDYKCIAAILKHAEVKNFQLLTRYTDKEEVSSLLEHMAKFAPFRFKRISVFHNSSLPFFIKNCPNLEKVDFCGKFYPFSFNEILEAPSLMNIKEFKFAKMYSEDFSEFSKGLVQKWIDNDVGVGKSIQFSMFFLESWPPSNRVFAEKFSDRVIEKTDKEVRIRMNNNTTQILFRQVGIEHEEFQRIHLVTEYCSCKVIPIDMPKSEYKNGDGWIQAIYKKYLKEDGILKNAKEFNDEDREVWRYYF